MRASIAALGLASLLAAGVAASAPQPLLGTPVRLDGETAGDQFGVAATCCDLNRDGRPEIIVGARDTDPNGVQDAGSVFVYSGRDRSLLRRFDGNVPFGVFGRSVLCCDVNRDRWPDLLVGAPNQGRVFVYSGRDWSLLLQLEPPAGTLQTGFSLACADVNRDRFPDIISGGPNFGLIGNGAGSVVVYSGKNGSILRQFPGTDYNDQFGASVSAGDVNRDGYADVVVGAPITDVDGRVDAGSVFIYSGHDGSLLDRFNGAAARDGVGVSTAVCDVSGDGYADVLFGSHGADPDGVLDAGSIYVLSGKDRALLRRFNGTRVADHLGFSLACGRIDRDRFPDILSGGIQGEDVPPPGRVEQLWVFSGKRGELLEHLEVPAVGDRFGIATHVCEGRTGRAVSLLAGAPFADPGERADAGSLFIYPVRTGRR